MALPPGVPLAGSIVVTGPFPRPQQTIATTPDKCVEDATRTPPDFPLRAASGKKIPKAGDVVFVSFFSGLFAVFDAFRLACCGAAI